MKCFLLGIVLTENLPWKFGVGRKEHSRLNEQIIFLSRDFPINSVFLEELLIYFLAYESLVRLRKSKGKLKTYTSKWTKSWIFFFLSSLICLWLEIAQGQLCSHYLSRSWCNQDPPPPNKNNHCRLKGKIWAIYYGHWCQSYFWDLKLLYLNVVITKSDSSYV